jgi:serine protease
VPANANPARVINMSLGGGGSCDSTTQTAINGARSRGTVVVVAAGNSNANAANYSPASCAGVVTIAATGRTGARAYYSNYGAVVDVAAPGGDMSGSNANGVY